jgi:uncharacterized membrane protein
MNAATDMKSASTIKNSWRQELLPTAILVGMFAAAAYSWSRVPDRIPTHWNAAGQADGFGGKFLGLLLMPIIATAINALMLVLPKFDPGRRNYENFRGAYLTIRLALLGFFTVLYGAAVYAAFGGKFNMTSVVMPAVGVMFLLLGNVMSKIRPNHFVGIRTPWTLSSKLSWNKTHRLGGWLFIAMGLACIAAGLAATQLLLPVILGSVLGLFCILLPYSYHVYKQDPDRVAPAGITPADDDARADADSDQS